MTPLRTLTPAPKTATRAPGLTARHARWFGAGLALGFLVPFVLTDVLEVPRDPYYGIYAVSVISFVALWARDTGQEVTVMLRRRRPLAVALGIGFAAVLALVVLRTDPATSGPEGLGLTWALVWRGVVYGVADALLLSVFPILAVFAAASGSRLRTHLTGTVAVGVAAMLASLLMTATYHAGYSDFRSEKMAKPLTGDLIWSVPTLVTLNPIGSVITHAGLHVTAVLHSYETETFLPPHP